MTTNSTSEIELYTAVPPHVLLELIAWGPAEREMINLVGKSEQIVESGPNELLYLVAVTETGEVLVCSGGGSNLEPDIDFRKANFLLPEEYESVDLVGKVKSLLKGKPLVMHLEVGDWVNERFLIWEKKDQEFINTLGVDRDDFIRLRAGERIARKVQYVSLLRRMNQMPETKIQPTPTPNPVRSELYVGKPSFSGSLAAPIVYPTLDQQDGTIGDDEVDD
ncbi:MAG: hypothetical protein K9M36_03515 [Candidatus Pacebacteria bacterium]|nr:hypothetical protein [Candidatus Paceibacterota bacterium]